MKHLLNNLSEQEKSNILAQHKGGIEIGTKNFKKLSESKLGNVKPLITEQSEERYVKAGFKKVNEINLPDGNYIGNPDNENYYTLANSMNVRYVNDVLVYSNDGKFTGYLLEELSPSRSGISNLELTLTGKKFGDWGMKPGGIFFKDSGYKPQAQSTETKKNPEITNKVDTEGIKNVLPEMISGPSFPGTYSGYVFGGTFNGTNYWWDCNGVDGMMGIRGMAEGKIISENNSMLNQQTKKEISDADPKGVWVGFYNKTSGSFVIYTTTAGKPKCVGF